MAGNAQVAASSVKRYYRRDKRVPFEEDALHEFKAHKNLSVEEIPAFTAIAGTDRRTRAPVSRSINAFLNAGIGGTVYLGILDNGEVKGLNLTIYQQDHVVVAVADLMTRYDPPVEPHRYSVQFVPIVDCDSTEEEISQAVDYDETQTADPEQRVRDHRLRTSSYCWCLKDCVAAYNYGCVSRDFVIEVDIKPWDPDHPDNKHPVGIMKAAPVHEDECGKVYFRRQASSKSYTPKELYEESKQRVHIHYMKKIHRLRDELETLRKQADI